MSPQNILLLVNTLRYLKFKQIAGRASYLARRYHQRWGYTQARVFPAPKWKPLRKRAPFLDLNHFNKGDLASGRFTFLNESVDFSGSIDWRAPGKGRLWRYNLHYFDYLRAAGGLPARIGHQTILDWIHHNPPGTADAWDPFPISLRTVNWMKYVSSGQTRDGTRDEIAESIFEQILWLEASLERHLLANHYFKNLKALIFAGLFFEGESAKRWLSEGLGLMQRELKEEILSDGGHFERSPMYHSMVLEDCLDLLNVCTEPDDRRLSAFAEYLRPVARRMLSFLEGTAHPDGMIPLFNDAAFNVEAEPNDLRAYFERVTGEKPQGSERTLRPFPLAGYFVMCPTPEDRLIIDCGPIGPDYQPGHSHCDTLSFELSLKGKRVVVDSGCYGYEYSEMRRYNRGNIGHNTLTIDGQNQSEVWSSHRCARRAYPLYADLMEKDGALVFKGAHDGYRRLTGVPTHERSIVWAGRAIRIEDRVTGRGKHDIELRLHINPELTVMTQGGRAIVSDKGEVIARLTSTGRARLEESRGWYCPEFGIKKPCSVLRSLSEKAELPFKSEWLIEVAG